MSWDEYVKNMTGRGAAQAAIFTQAGQPCAVSKDFNLSVSEVQTLKSCMAGNMTGDTKIEVNCQPCTMINFDKGNWVQVKTKKEVLSDAKVFYHFQASKTFYLVCGMTGASERNAANICHVMCEYLESLGM